MKIKIIMAMLALAVAGSSCDDYVDIVPKGNIIPQSTDDMGKLLDNASMAIAGSNYSFTDVSFNIPFFSFYSDDYNVPQDPSSAFYTIFASTPSMANTAQWADYIYGQAEDDVIWNGLYKSNYVCNYVLDNIDDTNQGVKYQRGEVKGQALVHRAMNYFLLTNLYGKQYNATTSASDLSVPLVLTADINAQYPRATVKEVYDQMLSDLTEAIGLLTTKVSAYNNRPSLAAAYALRARYYLWMQNYDAAYADATASLALKNTLIDYNQLQPNFPGVPAYGIGGYDTNVQTNPEVLYSRYKTESAYVPYSDKMMAIIDQQNDLRYTLFVGNFPAAGIPEPTIWTRCYHSGIDVSEVWLMKAETALRKSSPSVSEAQEALDMVRQNRYVADTYQPTTTTDRSELLTEIFNERRREITFTEMSFIDHKRQNADPTTARPMERTVYGQHYTMPVDDPHWQLAIPLNVMALNNKLVQNER